MTDKDKELKPTDGTAAPADEKTPEDRDARRRKARRRRARAFGAMLLRLLALTIVIYVLFFHLVGLTVMPTGDMYPRIDAGDLVLFYRLEKQVRAQDVIVFEKPTDALEQSYEEIEAAEAAVRAEKTWWRRALDWIGFRDPDEAEKTLFVCRVVAAPGDTVELSEGERLIVNGNAMVESGIFYPTPVYGEFVSYPLHLEEGEYFVLADSRNGGADSRFFGPVHAEEILGTVITILRRNNL